MRNDSQADFLPYLPNLRAGLSYIKGGYQSFYPKIRSETRFPCRSQHWGSPSEIQEWAATMSLHSNKTKKRYKDKYDAL